LKAGLKLAKTDRIPKIKLGLESEKDSEGPTRLGPELDLTLPFYDQGQAKQSRIQAQQMKNRHEIAALENRILTEVRTSRIRLLAAREIANRYQQQLIPLLKDSLEEAQLHYNFMLMGVYQLLQGRREEIMAQRQYIEALRDYWIERAQLERAVGTSLETPISSLKEAASQGEK
jgi:cobalt-zinc-cadmium efflux system outer membrane protein